MVRSRVSYMYISLTVPHPTSQLPSGDLLMNGCFISLLYQLFHGDRICCCGSLSQTYQLVTGYLFTLYIWLVKNDMDIYEHQRLSNITLRRCFFATRKRIGRPSSPFFANGRSSEELSSLPFHEVHQTEESRDSNWRPKTLF